MKIFGYTVKNESNPQELTKITLQVSPAKLRIIANFFNKAANDMEVMGKRFGHEYIQDFMEDWPSDNTDIIIIQDPNS
jgi:hypothetical protein